MTCYRIRGDRYLRGRHLDNCLGRLPDTERPTPLLRCRGCEPCPDSHCDLCSVTHSDDAHPKVCPECVGSVRADLDAIDRLEWMLPSQAMYGAHEGRLEAARPIPGGEAMALLAPSGPVGPVESLDDEATPWTVRTTWADEWETLDLDGRLTWAAQNEPKFARFAADVRKLRARLEDVLRAGERDERGAPCVHCSTELVQRCDPKRGLLDVYDCPRCRRSYSGDQYRFAVGVAYRAHSPTLTAEDLGAKLGVKANTIRQWAVRGHVTRRGVDDLGRVLFDVGDAEKRHAEQRTSSGKATDGQPVSQ